MKNLKDEEGKALQKSAAEIMADVFLEGMIGHLVLSHNQYGDTIANPFHAVKLYQDYMLKAKELALGAAEPRKKAKGSGGGIRIGSCCPPASWIPYSDLATFRCEMGREQPVFPRADRPGSGPNAQ
jgi:hypothetical protein